MLSENLESPNYSKLNYDFAWKNGNHFFRGQNGQYVL